ncbi:nucleotidyltransferase domain-containing protein [Candidatus Woesearchaeota archaeon]|nr:nucleotidyltransferase domain-containing protein [Candidatus Woesearchaeota archaeon]
MENKDFIAYALQYISYVFHNLKREEASAIKEVILFGSVARGEATAESDVDLFFDVYKKNAKLSESVKRLTAQFYESEPYRLWKNLGMDADIKPIVGILQQWKLQQSIIANGLTLLGKYRAPFTEGKPFVILYWQKIKSQSVRVALSKKLYGYSYLGRKYKGSLEGTGTKLASNCIMVPVEGAGLFFTIFKDMKIPYKAIYVGKMQ